MLAPAATAEPTGPTDVSSALELIIIDAREGLNLPKVCCLSGADTRPDRGLLIVLSLPI